MIVAVASGKGGTGKTFIATNLAALKGDVDFLDCDVEGANAHLFLRPSIERVLEVDVEVPEPVADLCTGCGECIRRCRFNALALVAGKVLVFPALCHSCDVCFAVCPASALGRKKHSLGTVRVGQWASGKFVDGELAIGEVRSAEVIRRLKREVKPDRDTILDCPPGASCSVVESVDGADLCIIVTEPTPLGLHDLEVTLGVLDHLGIPRCVVINRCDLGFAPVEELCAKRDVPILAHIPFDPLVSRQYSNGELVVGRMEAYEQIFQDMARAVFERAWEKPQRKLMLALGKSVEDGEVRPASAAGRLPRQLAVISGKGGTGKTTFSSALAHVAEGDVISDCDVEASNLHLVLRPNIRRSLPYEDTYVAEIDPEVCTGCGVCARSCRFGAIEIDGKAVVDPVRCEGCGLCEIVCPLGGEEPHPVTLRRRVSGSAVEGEWRKGPFVSAQIDPGGENSGRLVTVLRGIAQESAPDGKRILIDGAPGVGCPVNASLVSTDLAVIVTEPTPSGLHDMARAVELAKFLGVAPLVIVNKADLNPEEALRIENFCRDSGVRAIGRIPFDRGVATALSEGKSPVETDSEAGKVMAALAKEVLRCLGQKGKE